MASCKKKTALTSIEHGNFDTAALQQELAQALEDDRLYKLTDNMKKRAIHTATNYDEFKNLVACADLKPISQKELRDFSRTAPRTNLTYRTKPRKELGKSLNFKAPPADLHTPPPTSTDFCRNWKRYLKTDADKLGYLVLTGAVKLSEIFKSDLDADLFAEIVHVLVETWKADLDSGAETRQAEFAVGILEALSKTARLSLVLDFLDNNQQEKLQRLAALLDTSSAEHDASLAALKSKLKI